MDMIRADAASKKDLQSMLSELEEWFVYVQPLIFL